LGPENRNWAELEGGVRRPAWLTPNKPNWAKTLAKYGRKAWQYRKLAGGILGLGAGVAYGILSGEDAPKAVNRKPLPGYLDKLYPKKLSTQRKAITTEMAPIRRSMTKMRRRMRVIKKRSFRKRAPRRMRGKRRGRRIGRGKGSPLTRAIRRTSKRIRMGHYTNEKRYLKVCDVIDVGDYLLTSLTGVGAEQLSNVAKYRNLAFRISSLPNLVARLGSTSDKFDEFKIDKVTYKVTVLNARQLSMDPNYKAPDGSGQDAFPLPTNQMTNKFDYVPNTYVFHKRWQNDDLADADFLDWKKCKNGMRGACTFVNLFRQRGKMFNTAITADRADDVYINNTAILQKRHGQGLGWQKNTSSIQDLKIGQAGLILPGISKNGWDNIVSNIVPKLRVTVRVCSSLRANAAGIDIL